MVTDAALSEHFQLNEFLRSQAAARAGIPLIPPRLVIDNLARLCRTVLEPLRVSLGKPLTVTSGWRPEWLNELIGGAAKSAHMTGRAADIQVHGMPPVELAKYIRGRQFAVDKCILEFDEWCHVQVSENPSTAPRRLYLTASRVNGATRYTEGLA